MSPSLKVLSTGQLSFRSIYPLTAVYTAVDASSLAAGQSPRRAAGVSSGMILRFMAGERDLRLEAVDKIAAALGLRLCQDSRPEKRGANATLKTSEV